MAKTYLFLFNIVAIATNGKPSQAELLNSSLVLFLSGLPTMTVMLPRPVPRSIYLMTILTDNNNYVILLWTLIYSMRKVFLERAVVELVYKFNEKSTVSV